MNKIFMLILILILVIILASFAYLQAGKVNYCKQYALNSYQYGMAEDDKKDQAYTQSYQYCSEHYLEIRLLKNPPRS